MAKNTINNQIRYALSHLAVEESLFLGFVHKDSLIRAIYPIYQAEEFFTYTCR